MPLTGYTYSLNGFDFKLMRDLNNPDRFVLNVTENGEPVLNLHKAPFTRTFKHSARRERVDAFCHRFAADKAFRTSMLINDSFACC